MKKIIIVSMILMLLGGSLFAEGNDILQLKKEMKKKETGMLIGMTIIVVSIAAPVLYEGARQLKDKK